MLIATGYCRKSNQYYRLFIDLKRKAVTDFILSDGQQLPPRPENNLAHDTFVTDSYLCACPGCGQRVVSGCSCAEKMLPCEANVGFRFYCIYCSEMKILAAGNR